MLTDSISSLLGKPVILDTAGSIFYLGTLRECTADGLWLDDADVHNENEGHATKDLYILESCQHGIRANRTSVFVLQSAVLSVSALKAVEVE